MRHLGTVLAVIATSQLAWGAQLSVQDYLKQVQQHNQSFQSTQSQAQSAQGLAREADLLLAPQLFAEIRTGFDEKQQIGTPFTYDSIHTNVYSVGLSQQTRIGLQAKVSYLMTNNEVKGLDPALGYGTDAQFADGAAQLELSMPLWKNGFGRGVRANEDTIKEQAHAGQFAAQAQSAGIIANAENAYWRLAAAQEQVRIEEHALSAAQSIQNYVSDKSKKDLGERADVLQANALVEAYKLQIQQAQSELRSAQRDFNLYLNKDSTTPVPNLEALNFDSLDSIQIPKQRPGDRADVRASLAQAKLAKASSTLAVERNKPSLDLYGSYTAYGQTTEAGDTLEEVTKFKKDGAYVGLRFSMPLGSARSAARDGASQAVLAAEQNLSHLQFQQEHQWQDLVEKMSDAKQSLKLATAMERAQKSKLDNERARLRQGRTTTYQILLFEQEYNRAQSARVQAASLILMLNAQSKMYQTNLKGGQ